MNSNYNFGTNRQGGARIFRAPIGQVQLNWEYQPQGNFWYAPSTSPLNRYTTQPPPPQPAAYRSPANGHTTTTKPTTGNYHGAHATTTHQFSNIVTQPITTTPQATNVERDTSTRTNITNQPATATRSWSATSTTTTPGPDHPGGPHRPGNTTTPTGDATPEQPIRPCSTRRSMEQLVLRAMALQATVRAANVTNNQPSERDWAVPARATIVNTIWEEHCKTMYNKREKLRLNLALLDTAFCAPTIGKPENQSTTADPDTPTREASPEHPVAHFNRSMATFAAEEYIRDPTDWDKAENLRYRIMNWMSPGKLHKLRPRPSHWTTTPLEYQSRISHIQVPRRH